MISKCSMNSYKYVKRVYAFSLILRRINRRRKLKLVKTHFFYLTVLQCYGPSSLSRFRTLFATINKYILFPLNYMKRHGFVTSEKGGKMRAEQWKITPAGTELLTELEEGLRKFRMDRVNRTGNTSNWHLRNR